MSLSWWREEHKVDNMEGQECIDCLKDSLKSGGSENSKFKMALELILKTTAEKDIETICKKALGISFDFGRACSGSRQEGHLLP